MHLDYGILGGEVTLCFLSERYTPTRRHMPQYYSHINSA